MSAQPNRPMTAAKRVIARLDIKGDNVVRGIHLEGLRVVGKPEEMAERYCREGIDELVFIDTVASLYGRNNTLAVVERTARYAFLPLTVGGGIRTLQDVEAVLRAGGDKVTVNSAAVRRPALITEIAHAFGCQCVVAAIEAKRCAPGRWTVMIENGREPTGLDVVHWAQRCEELGAGEIMLTSIDRDGTRNGYDLELISAIAETVNVPVIIGGGPGKSSHVVDGLKQGGADAAALGTMLHFQLASIADVKTALTDSNISIRPIPAGSAQR